MTNMREFVRTVNLSDANVSIQTAGETFYRIFRWHESLTPEKSLTTTDVQTILHGSAILHIYYEIFGTELWHIFPNSKQNCCDLQKSFDKFQLESPLTFYSTKILLTKNSVNHIQAIEFYIRSFLTQKELLLILENVKKQLKIINQPNEELSILESIKRKKNFVSNKKDEAIYLVNQAFQFRNNDIENAMNRLINNLSFDYIAWIILERSETQSFEKCAIIQNEICKQLKNCSVNPRFLNSVYNITSANSEGLNLFYKSLGNENFSKALILFFLGYLKTIQNINEIIQPISKQFIDYDFYEIMFIIGATLNLRSPNRIDFYNALNSSDVISINLINIINQQNFVYDF